MEGMTNDEKIPVSLRERFTNIAANTDNREQYRQYENDLKVMDSTAISLCKDNNIPLVVFAMNDPKNIIRAVKGENIGTVVSND